MSITFDLSEIDEQVDENDSTSEESQDKQKITLIGMSHYALGTEKNVLIRPVQSTVSL